MQYENEIRSLGERVRTTRDNALRLRRRTRIASMHFKTLRSSVQELERHLDALWRKINRAHSSALRAHYTPDSSGRRRSCYDREDLLYLIVDDVSDTLMGVREKLHTAEEQWLALRECSDAADGLVREAERHRDEAIRDRDMLLAKTAGVPAEFLYPGGVLIKKSPRYEGQIDVYYGGKGTPAGPGHAHAVVDFRGKPVFHRRLGQGTPGSWLSPKRRAQAIVPLAA